MHAKDLTSTGGTEYGLVEFNGDWNGWLTNYFQRDAAELRAGAAVADHEDDRATLTASAVAAQTIADALASDSPMAELDLDALGDAGRAHLLNVLTLPDGVTFAALHAGELDAAIMLIETRQTMNEIGLSAIAA